MFTRSIVRRALVGVGLVMLGSSSSTLAQEALKYKWNKGDVLHYRSMQDNAGKMSAMGMERTTTQKQEFIQRFEVKEVTEGVATLDVSVLSIKIEMDPGTGQTGTFDSSKPAEQQYDGPPNLQSMMESMGVLVGEHLTVVIDGMGNVRKVEGMAKVLDKMQTKMGNANPMAARNLRNSLGDESIRGSMERFFKVLPEKAVKEGDTWNTSFEQAIPGAGGRMKIDSAWTMGGAEKLQGASVTKMTSKLKVEVVPPKEGEEAGLAPGMKTTITDGKGDGECYFDAKAGQLAKSVVNMTLPIEISVASQGQEMKAKNDTTSKFTFERIPAPEKKEEAPKTPPAGQ